MQRVLHAVSHSAISLADERAGPVQRLAHVPRQAPAQASIAAMDLSAFARETRTASRQPPQHRQVSRRPKHSDARLRGKRRRMGKR